jgi:outer membrane protein OmpA-like peptidoglycan-associated protein
MKKFLLLLTCLLSQPLLAEQFQAPVTDTRWQVVESPLECSLTQAIPGYGEAGFYRRNGSSLQLTFNTHSQPAEQNHVQFLVAPAPWQNSDETQTLTSLPTKADQTRFQVEGNVALEALAQLQEGRFPLIEYRSQSFSKNIRVMLSTIRLNDSLPAFQQCLQNLHPDSFEEISKLTVYFPLGKATLDAASKKALNRLADYVKLDDSIRQIRISSHTDNYGRKRVNEPLSDARAHAVKTYLLKEHELPAELIRVQSFIDHKPAASNKTVEGRARNRRAEITLLR